MSSIKLCNYTSLSCQMHLMFHLFTVKMAFVDVKWLNFKYFTVFYRNILKSDYKSCSCEDKNAPQKQFQGANIAWKSSLPWFPIHFGIYCVLALHVL